MNFNLSHQIFINTNQIAKDANIYLKQLSNINSSTVTLN